MGKIDILAELQKDNLHASAIALKVFADALGVYEEASRNVAQHGAIVMHPRTGAPMENPYLKIQTAKGAVIAKMRTIEAKRVLVLLQREPV